MSSKLESLPNEVLIHILSFVEGPFNMVKLCNVLPRSRRLAEPFLRQYLETYRFTGLSSLKNFTCFVIRNPYCRAYVKRVDFEGGYRTRASPEWWASESEERENNRDILLGALRKAGFPSSPTRYNSNCYSSAHEIVRKFCNTPDSFPDWGGDIDWQEPRDALVALLLTLLPHVEQMHMISWYPWAGERFITHLFEQVTIILEQEKRSSCARQRLAAGKVEQYAQSRPALTERSYYDPPILLRGTSLLHLTQVSYFYSQHDNLGGSNISEITPFLCLPRLRRLSGYCIKSDEIDDLGDEESQTGFLSLKSGPSRTYRLSKFARKQFSVNTLNLSSSVISIHHLERLVQTLRTLKHFHYTYGGDRVLRDRMGPLLDGQAFSGPRIAEMLSRHAKSTLLSLSLSVDPWDFGHSVHDPDDAAAVSTAPMGSLQAFQVLEYLSVPFTLLLGPVGNSSSYRLADVLPGTLISLCIYHSPYRSQENARYLTELVDRKDNLMPSFTYLKIGISYGKDTHRSDDRWTHEEFLERNPAYVELGDVCRAAHVELSFFEYGPIEVDKMNATELETPHIY